MDKEENLIGEVQEEKKLFYELSDLDEVSCLVMELSGCMAWIEEDMRGVTSNEDEDQREYTITPIWLTDKEFNNLPEANL